MTRRDRYRVVLAIDPGASGGLAWENGLGEVDCCAMPKSITDLPTFLCSICEGNGAECYAIVENVPTFLAGMQTSTAAMAKLHQNYGYILGALDTLGFNVKLRRPQEWQKRVGAGDKKNYGNRWKAHLKELAVRRFPQLRKRITLKTADALLILASEI